MKKSLFFVATAAVVLASCSSDVKIDENTVPVGSNQQREIAFSPLAQRHKRAADTYQYAIDGATFPTDLNMYVAAHQVTPKDTTYFTKTQFVYTSGEGTATRWHGVPAKYWPLDSCYINFLAYANVTGTAKFGNELDTPVPAAYKAVITQSDNSSAQTDLMYAIGNGAVTKSGNNLSFPEQVNMQFFHAQAWVDFYVKATTDGVETNITIDSIKLNGAKYAGTYTITHTNHDKKTGQEVSGAWTLTASQKDVVVPGWSPAALTTSLVKVGKGLLVVPDDNTSTADWTSFTVYYKYENKPYNYTYAPEDAANRSVDQKKHYVYNITFKLHEILVHATVEDWTDSSSNITVQN